MRYAVVNQQGDVVNIIEYDGKSDFHPGEGLTLRKANLTDRIVEEADEAVSVSTPSQIPPEVVEDLQARLAGTNSVAGIKGVVADMLDQLTATDQPTP